MPSPTQVTPTLQIAENSTPDCYPVQEVGLWCYMLVKNDQSYGLENLTGKIILTTGNAADTKEQNASGLINILPAGKSFPLAAYFTDQPAGSYQVEGQIILALPQPANDQRYLAASIVEQQVILSTDKKSAQATGKISLAAGTTAAQQVWVLLVAYTSEGKVAGLRKWEASAVLNSGDNLPFDTFVYSLGPEIDHVDSMVEARP
jgi:hypothetical protein